MTAVRIEEQTIDDRMTVNETKQMVFYGIRWSAIFAGVVVGIAVQAMLGLLGFAGGLSSMSGVYSGESASFGPMLWAMVSLLVSAFAGGFFAARFSGSRRRGDGALYGAVNWAVSVLLFALILSTTAGTILNGMFAAANTTIVYSGTVVNVPPVVVSGLQQELGNELDAAGLQQLQQYLLAGQRKEAEAYLTSHGITASRASTIVDDAMDQIGSSTVIAAEPLLSPEQLVKAVTAAAWMVFVGVAFSLIVSMCGGVMGARYVARRMPYKKGYSRMA